MAKAKLVKHVLHTSFNGTKPCGLVGHDCFITCFNRVTHTQRSRGWFAGLESWQPHEREVVRDSQTTSQILVVLQ